MLAGESWRKTFFLRLKSPLQCLRIIIYTHNRIIGSMDDAFCILYSREEMVRIRGAL